MKKFLQITCSTSLYNIINQKPDLFFESNSLQYRRIKIKHLLTSTVIFVHTNDVPNSKSITDIYFSRVFFSRHFYRVSIISPVSFPITIIIIRTF